MSKLFINLILLFFHFLHLIIIIAFKIYERNLIVYKLIHFYYLKYLNYNFGCIEYIYIKYLYINCVIILFLQLISEIPLLHQSYWKILTIFLFLPQLFLDYKIMLVNIKETMNEAIFRKNYSCWYRIYLIIFLYFEIFCIIQINFCHRPIVIFITFIL